MQPEIPTFALFAVIGLMATAASAQVVRQEVPGIRNFAKVESTVACAGAITLSSASSGSLASVSGSLSYTSTAAIPGRPARSAATSAPGAINPARLLLTRSAEGFMRDMSSAVTIPRVAGTRRMWSDSTSHAAKNVCLFPEVARHYHLETFVNGVRSRSPLRCRFPMSVLVFDDRVSRMSL